MGRLGRPRMTECKKCGKNVDEETHYLVTIGKWKGSRGEDGTLSIEHKKMKPEDSYLQLCSKCCKGMTEWVEGNRGTINMKEENAGG